MSDNVEGGPQGGLVPQELTVDEFQALIDAFPEWDPAILAGVEAPQFSPSTDSSGTMDTQSDAADEDEEQDSDDQYGTAEEDEGYEEGDDGYDDGDDYEGEGEEDEDDDQQPSPQQQPVAASTSHPALDTWQETNSNVPQYTQYVHTLADQSTIQERSEAAARADTAALMERTASLRELFGSQISLNPDFDTAQLCPQQATGALFNTDQPASNDFSQPALRDNAGQQKHCEPQGQAHNPSAAPTGPLSSEQLQNPAVGLFATAPLSTASVISAPSFSFSPTRPSYSCPSGRRYVPMDPQPFITSSPTSPTSPGYVPPPHSNPFSGATVPGGLPAQSLRPNDTTNPSPAPILQPQQSQQPLFTLTPPAGAQEPITFDPSHPETATPFRTPASPEPIDRLSAAVLRAASATDVPEAIATSLAPLRALLRDPSTSAYYRAAAAERLARVGWPLVPDAASRASEAWDLCMELRVCHDVSAMPAGMPARLDALQLGALEAMVAFIARLDAEHDEMGRDVIEMMKARCDEAAAQGTLFADPPVSALRDGARELLGRAGPGHRKALLDAHAEARTGRAIDAVRCDMVATAERITGLSLYN